MSYIPRHVCRLCLWQTFPLTSIWSRSLMELEIAKKINTIFPFTVDKNDGLPSEICEQCTYKLDTFFEFYQHAVVSHSKLRFCFRRDGGRAQRLGEQRHKEEIIEIPSPEPSTSTHVDSEMPPAEYSDDFGGSNGDAGNHEQVPPLRIESSVSEVEDNQRSLPSCSADQPMVDLPAPETSFGKPASTKELSAAEGSRMVDKSEGKKEKLLKCSHCRNEFKTRVEIALHFCDSPNNAPKRLSCRYCYRQFHDGATLASHKKKHLSQFAQTCGKCGKLFKTARSFRSHTNICASRSQEDLSRPRTAQAPNHTCGVCNRQFFSVGGMKLHYASREHRANLKQKELKGGVSETETDHQWGSAVTDTGHELKDYDESEGTDDVFDNGFSAAKSTCSEPELTDSNMGNTKTGNMVGHEEEEEEEEEERTNNPCLRRRTYSDSLWLVN